MSVTPTSVNRHGHRARELAAGIFHALAGNADLIVLVLLGAVVCNFGLSFSDFPVPRDTINAVDESWEVDLIHKASQGIWSGRDVLFTYGPLWQALASLLPRAKGLTTGAVFKQLYLFNYWGAFLLAFLAGRLLLPQVASWRRAVLLMAVVVFWAPYDVRLGLALLAFAITLRLSASLQPGRGLLARSAVLGALVIASFLLSMDAGSLSVAAIGAVLFSCFLVEPSSRASILRLSAGAAAATVAGALMVNAWSAAIGNFRFWIWSARMTSAYRWLMAQGMLPESAYRMAWTIAACCLIGLVIWLARDAKSESITMRPVFLIAAVLFSGVAIQKGIARSDWGHVNQCLYPSIFFCGVALTGFRARRWPAASDAGVLAVVALTLLFSGPGPLFRITGAVGRVLWTPPSYPSCPAGTYYADEACLLPREYAALAVPAAYVTAHSLPDEAVFVYPYQNLLGLLSRRRVSGGVLQNYAVGGEYLTSVQLAALERDRPPLGVFCADELISWPVDGISNFQRTAPVWLFLQSHYSAEAEPVPGVMVLRRDDRRAGRIRQTEFSLWRANSPAPSTSATVPPSAWNSAADFLRVRVKTKYPALWKIAKPSAILMTLQFADGSSRETRLSIEPDRTAEIWVYPWSEANLRDYFRADASEWRSSAGRLPAVRSVSVRAVRQDQLSVQPSTLAIESVDGVGLTLTP